MCIINVLKAKYNNWKELELEIEKITETTEKGDAFEQLSYFYLLFHKSLYQIKELYSPKIKGREIPKEIEDKLHLSHKDDGVDGVFVTNNGQYTAYQVKFRSDRKCPSSNELNNFWAEAEYADNRLVIANCPTLPKDTEKRKNVSTVLVDKFDDLGNDFFEYLYEVTNGNDSDVNIEKLKPLKFQEPIIDSIVKGFGRVDRGKIIAACASGKTLIALWASEEMKSETVLFFAPNLSLIRQSIERWTSNANDEFQYLAVCSDITVSGKSEDDLLTNLIDLDVPVTTDAAPITKFLTDVKGKKVIFSTYQSVECLIEALKNLSGFKFDLAIYDEAHRTAGRIDSGLFNLALLDSNIPVSKRLFMTATEKLIRPWIKDRLEQEDRIVFSMDDEDTYGPTFYKFTFGEAIKQKVISDYQIIIAGITDSETKKLVDSNRYVADKNQNGSLYNEISADTLFKAMLLGKAVKLTGMKKIVSFHSSVAAAKEFISVYDFLDDELIKNQFGIDKKDAVFLHVNGSQSTSERCQSFKRFEDSEFGLLSNVRCLTEGVDMPFIDGILFADPKGSMIDVVQAVGRALRKPLDIADKTAYIVIPVRFNSDGTYVEDDFVSLHFVIQALRDQDETLAEWIDDINWGVVRGRTGRRTRGKNSKIQFVVPTSVDMEKFANDLEIRIATVNSKATGQVGLGATLGKKERKSTNKRTVKSFGDYNKEPYKKSIVDPTLVLFDDKNSKKLRTDIMVNNNVSHCCKLGVIRKTNANTYELTTVGKKYYDGEITFDSLFLNQMLLYQEEREKIYPYRLMLEVLIRSKTMNYIEFLYAVYSNQAGDIKAEVKLALNRIKYLRKNYPEISMTSPANQDKVRNDLNIKYDMNLQARDVWSDRTTPGNQYRYMMNHLLLLSKYLNIDLKSKEIRVNVKGTNGLKKLLASTIEILQADDYKYGEMLWVTEEENLT